VKLSIGHGYWVSNFPPLDGGEPKRRTAIYLDLDGVAPPPPPGWAVFVGTSTEEPNSEKDHDAIWIRFGFPEPCWVFPRWTVDVPIVEVREWAGEIYDVQLEPLMNAVVDRLYESGSTWISEP